MQFLQWRYSKLALDISRWPWDDVASTEGKAMETNTWIFLTFYVIGVVAVGIWLATKK